MFCPKCGNSLTGNEEFCPKCGYTMNFQQSLVSNNDKKNLRKKFILFLV